MLVRRCAVFVPHIAPHATPLPHHMIPDLCARDEGLVCAGERSNVEGGIAAVAQTELNDVAVFDVEIGQATLVAVKRLCAVQ